MEKTNCPFHNVMGRAGCCQKMEWSSVCYYMTPSVRNREMCYWLLCSRKDVMADIRINVGVFTNAQSGDSYLKKCTSDPSLHKNIGLHAAVNGFL